VKGKTGIFQEIKKAPEVFKKYNTIIFLVLERIPLFEEL
jgi:hypothetical protein